MLSSLVHWDHTDSWPVPTVTEFIALSSGGSGSSYTSSVEVNVSSPGSEDAYLTGHVIDGRLLFPTTFFLVLAWKQLARMNGQTYQQTPVCFEDVRIHRGAILPTTGKPVCCIHHNYCFSLGAISMTISILVAPCMALWGNTHLSMPIPMLIECPANGHFRALTLLLRSLPVTRAAQLMLTFEGPGAICINLEHYYGPATNWRRFRIHELPSAVKCEVWSTIPAELPSAVLRPTVDNFSLLHSICKFAYAYLEIADVISISNNPIPSMQSKATKCWVHLSDNVATSSTYESMMSLFGCTILSRARTKVTPVVTSTVFQTEGSSTKLMQAIIIDKWR